MQVVFAPSFFCVENQMPLSKIYLDIFSRTPMIRRIVIVCEVVDRFLRKPY